MVSAVTRSPGGRGRLGAGRRRHIVKVLQDRLQPVGELPPRPGAGVLRPIPRARVRTRVV